MRFTCSNAAVPRALSVMLFLVRSKSVQPSSFSNFFTWRIFDAGYRLSEAILNYDVMEKVLRRFQETYRFDAHFDLGSRNPLRISNALGGKKYTIEDESGAVSYLDESLMTAEQYDALIENPAAFTWEVILKNHLPELTLGQLKNGALELIRFMQFSEHINKVFVEEYQCKLRLDATRPAGVPFETLFQTYRGMVGISKDLRRCPERVEQALQVLFDTTIAPQLKACDFSAPTPSVAGNYIIMMAHSILNEKQFARFYWPHFKAIFDAVHAQNGTMFVFSEAQILRFADFMDEIPKGIQEAAQALDFLPPEQREQFLMFLAGVAQMF